MTCEVSESLVPRRIHQCFERRPLTFCTRWYIGFIRCSFSGMSAATRLVLSPVVSFFALYAVKWRVSVVAPPHQVVSPPGQAEGAEGRGGFLPGPPAVGEG